MLGFWGGVGPFWRLVGAIEVPLVGGSGSAPGGDGWGRHVVFLAWVWGGMGGAIGWESGLA